MSKEKWGSSQSWWCRPAVWPPGENWGGYAAASRSPSGSADGVAARAATPSGGVNMKYKLSLVLKRAAARAGEEIVYHYTKEPQTCVLASYTRSVT